MVPGAEARAQSKAEAGAAAFLLLLQRTTTQGERMVSRCFPVNENHDAYCYACAVVDLVAV